MLTSFKNYIYNQKFKFAGGGGQGFVRINKTKLDGWLSFGLVNIVVIVTCPVLTPLHPPPLINDVIC